MSTLLGITARAAPKPSYKGENNDKTANSESRATPREQLVLFAINDRRVYGLEIKAHIDKCTGGRQKISIGALYPILQSLEEKGFIASEWGDESTCGARRRYHYLTDAGRSVINDVLYIQKRLLCGQ